MIKVLIIDDSPLIRALLREILQQAPDMQVVGEAEDPYQARDLIKRLNPDVLTLDIEMPKMDGISFLRNLMRLRPMPVVMISTLTQQGAPVTLESLEIGAVDFIAKPTKNVASELNAYADTLIRKVRAAATAKVRPYKVEVESVKPIQPKAKIQLSQLIAIGASTGGTEAIKEVITRFPSHFPAVVITQHIPPVFSASFAERMDRCCDMRVKEAEHGEKIVAGTVYIAPGDFHFTITNKGSGLYCDLSQSEPVNRHRPAIDVMFNSLVKIGHKNVVATILTGMGSDGAAGLLNLKKQGAYTIAQDEATSVVFGMPKAAIEMNAQNIILPLEKIAFELIQKAAKV